MYIFKGKKDLLDTLRNWAGRAKDASEDPSEIKSAKMSERGRYAGLMQAIGAIEDFFALRPEIE